LLLRHASFPKPFLALVIGWLWLSLPVSFGPFYSSTVVSPFSLSLSIAPGVPPLLTSLATTPFHVLILLVSWIATRQFLAACFVLLALFLCANQLISLMDDAPADLLMSAYPNLRTVRPAWMFL
jgi:hypothetical protein